MNMSTKDKQIAQLREIVSELISSPIEHDPDEGPRCFWCGGRVDIRDNIEHHYDCPVVRAQAILEQTAEEAQL